MNCDQLSLGTTLFVLLLVPGAATIAQSIESKKYESVARIRIGERTTPTSDQSSFDSVYFAVAEIYFTKKGSEWYHAPQLSFYDDGTLHDYDSRTNRVETSKTHRQYIFGIPLKQAEIPAMIAFIDKFQREPVATSDSVTGRLGHLKLRKTRFSTYLLYPEIVNDRWVFGAYSHYERVDLRRLKLALFALQFRLDSDSLHDASNPLSALDGSWDGGRDWGEVKFKAGNGTYSATYSGEPGLLKVKPEESGVFQGTWSEPTLRPAPHLRVANSTTPVRHGTFTSHVSKGGQLVRLAWKSSDGKSSGTDILVRK